MACSICHHEGHNRSTCPSNPEIAARLAAQAETDAKRRRRALVVKAALVILLLPVLLLVLYGAWAAVASPLPNH